MKIAIQGLGYIGVLVARVALRKGLEIVGAVDVDPNISGRDLGELIGVGEMGIKVRGDLEGLLREEVPDVLVNCTTSNASEAFKHFRPAVLRGMDVISTCETLVYPYYRYPELASEIDALARSTGSVVVGAGINPGYLLDVLPAFLTSPCSDLRSIRCVRVVDASKRRSSFKKKIGLNLERSEFEESLRSGKITGHVGMAESALLLAKSLSLEVSSIKEVQRPILAEKEMKIGDVHVSAGRVMGIEAECFATARSGQELRLTFRACVGCEEYEEIEIVGEPSVKWRSTGIHGDLGTAAYVTNLIPKLTRTIPGLRLVSELEIPSWWAGRCRTST